MSAMSTDRARLLLHPVRMRVVMALSAEDLTTRQISELIPDVPQASLYRAVAQLHDAQVIEIAKEVPRGGALERTYRMCPTNGLITLKEFTSGTPEEFLATVQAFSDTIVTTTARHLAHAEDTWRDDEYGMRYEALWLSREDRAELGEDLRALLRKYTERERTEASELWAMMVAVIPDHTATAPAEGDEGA
jgi:hypothetical protein